MPSSNTNGDHKIRGVGLALLGFVALSIGFYAPLLSGLRTFPDGDFNRRFLPFSLFQHRAISGFHLPV